MLLQRQIIVMQGLTQTSQLFFPLGLKLLFGEKKKEKQVLVERKKKKYVRRKSKRKAGI